MTVQDLVVGDLFTFAGYQSIWEYRGNRWYASPEGYDGGPWTASYDEPVELIAQAWPRQPRTISRSPINSVVFWYDYICPKCGIKHASSENTTDQFLLCDECKERRM